MNQLLKNVLKLIKKNIGNENAPWMTRIAGIILITVPLYEVTEVTEVTGGRYQFANNNSCRFYCYLFNIIFFFISI